MRVAVDTAQLSSFNIMQFSGLLFFFKSTTSCSCLLVQQSVSLNFSQNLRWLLHWKWKLSVTGWLQQLHCRIWSRSSQYLRLLQQRLSEEQLNLGEKCVTAVSRVGRSSSDGIKPVKVNFSSSTSAQQILSKARRLKDMQPRKTVYVCHDRSPEERAARREIVMDLKTAAAAQPDPPDRVHFIKEIRFAAGRRVE